MSKPPSLLCLMPMFVVIFIGFIGFSMMITLFTPLFISGKEGLIAATFSKNQRLIILGVILSLYPLGQVFGSPVLGALSDRFGRKPVLLVSLFVTTICYGLISIALSKMSLWLLIVSSLIAGISEGNTVIAQSAVADVTAHHHRNRFFGYIYLSRSLGYVVGPLLAGKLSDSQLIPWFSNATPFWVVFGFLWITMIWVAASFKETRSLQNRATLSCFKAFINLHKIFTDRDLRVLYLINFLVYFSVFGFFCSYPMYIVNEFHVTTSQLSEFIAYTAVTIVITNIWLTGVLSKHLSLKKLTLLSAIFAGIFMLSIIIFPTINTLWGTLLFTSFAVALCLPSCASMLSVAAKDHEQGQVMGNNQSLQVAAQAFAAFVTGFLAAAVIKLPLSFFAIIAFMAAAILLFHRKR